MTLPFFTPARRPEDEARRQAAVDAVDPLGRVDDPDLVRIVAAAAALFDAPMATLSIIDRDRQWYLARHGVEAAGTSRAVAFCAHAILRPGTPLVVPDLSRDVRFAGNPMVLGQGVRFYVGAPLVSAAGEALGALCALDRTPRALAPDDAVLGRLDALQREAAALLQARPLRSAA